MVLSEGWSRIRTTTEGLYEDENILDIPERQENYKTFYYCNSKML